MSEPEIATEVPQEPSSVPLPGNVALSDWFAEKRGRRAALARILDVSVGTVGSWGNVKNPGRPREALHLLVISECTGIPLEAWIAHANLEALKPVLANWESFVFTPAARRPKHDPRQMHFDEALARLAGQESSEEKDAALVAPKPATDTIPAPDARAFSPEPDGAAATFEEWE